MNRRLAAIVLVLTASLVVVLSLGSITQDPAYHDFADRRAFLGIPNFLDVVSNLPFLLVGLAGVRLCVSRPAEGARVEWTFFFIGVALVAFGSGYYHWSPSNATLAWDRAPMTIAFMALFSAIIGESLGERAGRLALGPLLLLGMVSVIYWRVTGDLRIYAWVQFFPLLAVPLLLVLFRTRFSHRRWFAAGLLLYGLSKAFEALDLRIFELSAGAIGGHAVKHLFAAAACLAMFRMLQVRRRTA